MLSTWPRPICMHEWWTGRVMLADVYCRVCPLPPPPHRHTGQGERGSSPPPAGGFTRLVYVLRANGAREGVVSPPRSLPFSCSMIELFQYQPSALFPKTYFIFPRHIRKFRFEICLQRSERVVIVMKYLGMFAVFRQLRLLSGWVFRRGFTWKYTQFTFYFRNDELSKFITRFSSVWIVLINMPWKW